MRQFSHRVHHANACQTMTRLDGAISLRLENRQEYKK